MMNEVPEEPIEFVYFTESEATDLFAFDVLNQESVIEEIFPDDSVELTTEETFAFAILQVFFIVAFVAMPFGIWMYQDLSAEKQLGLKLNLGKKRPVPKKNPESCGKKEMKKKFKAVLKDNNTKVSLIN